MPYDRILTIDEAGLELGVSRYDLLRWIRKEGLIARQVGKGFEKYLSEKVLVRWVDSHQALVEACQTRLKLRIQTANIKRSQLTLEVDNQVESTIAQPDGGKPRGNPAKSQRTTRQARRPRG